MTERIEFEGLNGVRLAGDVRGPVGVPNVVLVHGRGQTRYSLASWHPRRHEVWFSSTSWRSTRKPASAAAA